MDNLYAILLKWIVFLVPCYWLLRPLRTWFIPSATLLFFACYAPWSGLSLALITALTYIGCQQSQNKPRGIMACCGILLTLFIFYKANLHVNQTATSNFVLLGFAYYLLRALHYSVDHYRLALPPHNFSQYVNYMFFLPAVSLGPIHRFPDFIRDHTRQRWDTALFAQGIKRLVYGYAKIILLANLLIGLWFNQWLVKIAPTHPSIHAYAGCVQYGLNLYCQFSGYADIAIGFSNLLGLRLMENFNYPFLKKNIMEFWQAWHISLSQWCRDYVYAPLTAVTRKPVLGIFVAMLSLGLWHELSMRYVLWSLYQGLGIAAYHAMLRAYPLFPSFIHKLLKSKIGIFCAWLLTQNYIILSFAITKETKLLRTYQTFQKVFGSSIG